MGIDVFLADERGQPRKAVPDCRGLLARLVREAVAPDSVCLRFIDPWGDTTFNRLQMPRLIEELEGAIRRAGDEAIGRQGQSVLDLARECRDGAHLYLKFCGD